jgi:hypothetical protein
MLLAAQEQNLILCVKGGDRGHVRRVRDVADLERLEKAANSNP